MRDGGLLERLAQDLQRQGGPVEIRSLAAGLLMAPDSELAQRVLEAILEGDPRFVVREGSVSLRPTDSVFLGSPLRAVEFAVLDFETNGLEEDRAIEVGVVCMRDGKVTDSFSSLLDPGTPVAPFVTRMTGIASEHLAGQPGFAEVWPRLQDYLSGRILVAHNLPFDRRILRREVGLLGGDRRIGHQALCTLRLARRLFPGEDSKSLDALAERFSLTFTARHRALGDAAVTGALLYRLIDEAARHAPMETWNDLAAFVGTTRPRRRRRKA